MLKISQLYQHHLDTEALLLTGFYTVTTFTHIERIFGFDVRHFHLRIQKNKENAVVVVGGQCTSCSNTSCFSACHAGASTFPVPAVCAVSFSVSEGADPSTMTSS
jgi:hypothetical protein